MSNFTLDQVGSALKNLGNYRVRRAQVVALEGRPDGISGSLLLSLGLRETRLQNIEGGAKLVNGKWVPEDDPRRMDVGIFQISRRFHLSSLKLMPGVRAGTWSPVILGQTAADAGHCPRFEDSLRYTLNAMHEAMAFGEEKGVKQDDLPRFAVAAHNGGWQGALDGYRAGNVDKYTTEGNYSAWVIYHRRLVNKWLLDHPKWIPS